jgi:hypothetical protein
MLPLLVACADAPATTAGAGFAAYAGDVGRLYELRVPAPPGDTADTAAPDTAAPDTTTPSRWLRVADTTWTLTEGATADAGTPIATWTTRRESGLFLDDVRLLPVNVLAGKSADGATIRAVATWDTVYGSFPDAAEVEITTEGAWAGTQVFAKGVGPVFLTIDGAAWETAWYE